MELALPASERATCLHCGNPTEAGCGPFCCTGCRMVYSLLHSEHLERYYDLRGERGVPVPEARIERRDLKWLEAVEAKRRASGAGLARVDLDVQGLHCSACVWLIDSLFARRPGAGRITVNPTLGRAQLLVEPAFDLAGFVQDVERFGYLLGPPLKTDARRSSDLAMRMGICIALAMNAMIFAIATYAGLREGPTFDLVQRWNLGISFASFVVGGSVFFRSAWQGLRRGILHLDLPIALGIGLAFAGSVYGYAAHRTSGVFIDTLDVFIALMLVGRFLQERVIERNRSALLASDGVDGLLTRRERGGVVETVRCTEIRTGDRLVIAHGDLVPIDATLDGPDGATFSLDWINGESRSRTYCDGELVPAGAFLTATRPATVLASADFATSPLIELLRTPTKRAADDFMSAPWWRLVTRWYVVFVLTAAAGGFVGWFMMTGDLSRSIAVATAVLVVTCPCSFGIATPLAYDLVQAGLRRAGLFVRSAGFLDRAEQIRQVVFDKTGTLTSGALHLRGVEPLERLAPAERHVLSGMVGVSSHPKSVAVQRALADLEVPLALLPGVHEVPGKGLVCVESAVEYRLGAPAWAAPDSASVGDLAFAANGRLLASLETEEALRPDAVREVRALREAGYDVWLLSGDDSARATQTARVVGIPESHAVGGASAEAKAAWVAAHDRQDLLMIGDGINDSLVVAGAFCSGTPAIDRPFMAARSDFYFVTPGLRCLRLALDASRKLGAVRRRNLALALAYNVLSVSLAYAGVMSPLVCAVFMPTTSIATILATTLTLNSRSALWRS
ncbi:MAG TPA: heavy metal translocating P-type ATPase metal-binding domain-containing protein [Polyangiaceae bacterium]